MIESNYKKLKKIEDYANYMLEAVNELRCSFKDNVVVHELTVDKIPSCCENCRFSEDIEDYNFHTDDIYCTLLNDVYSTSDNFNKYKERGKNCPLKIKNSN